VRQGGLSSAFWASLTAISARQKSKSVWVASGDYDGMRHSAEDLSYTATRTIWMWRHRGAPARLRQESAGSTGRYTGKSSFKK
jgi:hypothetical protein